MVVKGVSFPIHAQINTSKQAQKRIYMKGMKNMSSKNIFNKLYAKTLVSLFLLLLGGWNTQAWGDTYNPSFTNTSTTTWNDGNISLTFSNVSENSNGYELASTGLGSAEKDKLKGTMSWSCIKTGYSIKVTKAEAGFKTGITYSAYGVYGRIYNGNQSAYTSKMYTNGETGTATATITNESGFGTTFTFTSGRNSVSGKTYLNNLKLTYTITPNTYTVTFNANGGSVGTSTSSTSTVTYDATYGAGTGGWPTPTRTNYTFTGWYTTASGGTKVESTTTVNITSAQTLHAHWTPTYYVAFNGNGSTSGSMSNETMAYQIAKNLTANSYSRAYTVTYNANGGTCGKTSATATYTFANWNTNADGSGTKYANSASVSDLSSTPGATVTLYAQWNSGSVTLPNATKTNAVIEGWYDGSTKVGVPGDAYTPTTNTTLTAKWIAQYPFTMSGSDRTMDVGDEISPAFTFTYAENPTAHITVQSISSVNSGDTVVEYDAVNNKLIARNAGQATIYFTQANTATILPGTSETWTITVNKIANTLERTVATYEMYVDDELAGIINSSVAVKNRNNNDVAVTVTTSDEDLIRYVSGEDKIIVPNTANEMFGASKVVNVIFSQPEIAPDELQEIYEAIKEFAYSFDIDSIDGIIERARQYKIPEEEASRFEAVETAARNMDWDELNKALA